MDNAAILSQATGLGQAAADALGLELVDVELVREGGSWYLRFYIDKTGGVGINDCEALSRRVSEELDRIDPIPVAYHLEVSSPGAERPLTKDSDFTRFAGEMVHARLFGPHEGRRTFEGELVGRTAAELTLKVDGREVVIPNELVSKVRLAVKF